MHHQSHFLLEIIHVERREFRSVMSRNIGHMVNPLAKNDVYAEGNVENTSESIPINISRTLDVVENVFIGVDCSHNEICQYMILFKEFHDVFSWSYEEMLGIAPRIVEHEIQTYENAKPVQQKLGPFSPRKATTIKDEVEKLLKASFIYPIPLT
jgi:hypothetical protein